MKRLNRIVIAVCLAASLCGCAVYLADVQGLRKVKKAYTKVFDKDLPRCYSLSQDALIKWNAVIFQQRKNDYIVAMNLNSVFRNCVSTTELAIFFTQTAPGKTEIKVTSLNHHLSEFVAGHLFNYIEKEGKVPAEEEPAFYALPTGGRY